MRIHSVEAVNPKTNEKLLFEFDTITKDKKLVTTKGGRLDKYLEYCFEDDADCADDVTVKFSVNGDKYIIKKARTAEGAIRSTLKKEVNGKMQNAAGGKNVLLAIETLCKGGLQDLFSHDYVTDKAVEEFNGNLSFFREIKLLLEINENADKAAAQINEKNDAAKETLRQLASNYNGVTKRDVEEVSVRLADVTAKVNTLNTEITQLKMREASGIIAGEILTELAATQTKYQRLVAQKDDIEHLRSQLATRDSIAALIPKLGQLETLAKQRADFEKRRYAVVTELEWQENELSNLVYQLEEKQRLSAGVIEKRSKIEVINQELTTIAELYAKNKEFNEQLVKFTEELDRLNAEKVLYKNKIVAVENKIREIKSDIDKYKVPNSTVGELLETIRVNVKIDEVQAQVDKLQSEIALKESQIAEKESNLVLQVKRFKSVAELDVAVAPIKAKDTILQVLESKYRKLELITAQLNEKQRNLQRAYEDYKYRILQIEHGLTCLTAELQKTVQRKQEEFKREVFLNSQKVYSDDASGIFAVTTNFEDEEVASLRQDCEQRNFDRDVLLEKASELQGKIEEITRQIAINNAEMATLNSERNNINKRYSEIVTQNRNEAVFHYLKALESNNGTRYLLDVQQDAVRNEAELSELKRSVESLRMKLSGLQSRLRYLYDTQKTLDTHDRGVEQLVAANDQVKDGLSDIGEALLSNYEQYRAVSEQLDDTESKLTRLQESIIEITKSIKVNENQIALSAQKAKKYAGSDDIEKAVAAFRFEMADVDSEVNMLSETKGVVEKDVFKKRLELEKLQYMYESKNTEYTELFDQVQYELNLRGLNAASVSSYNFSEDSGKLRKTLSDYDSMRHSLAERIENYYALLKSQPGADVEVNVSLSNQIAALQAQLDSLSQQQRDLEQQRSQTLAMYMASNNSKLKLAIATTEAKALSEAKQAIKQHEVIKLLIDDKIRLLVGNAQSYFQQLCGTNFTLEIKDNGLVVNDGSGAVQYGSLTKEQKYNVYISMLLGVPQTAGCNWLIFEERPGLPRETLANIMSRLSGISGVVACTRTAPTPPPQEVKPVEAPETAKEAAPELKESAPQEIAPLQGEPIPEISTETIPKAPQQSEPAVVTEIAQEIVQEAEFLNEKQEIELQ